MFDHKRYLVIGTNEDGAEGLKNFLNAAGSTVNIEVSELEPDQVKLLADDAKSKLIAQYSELY